MDSKNKVFFCYDAFISYRHSGMDGIIAEKLHKALELYTTPVELQKLGLPKKLTRVFRDRDELPVSSNLSDNLFEALEQSRFLIVICSKRTPESLWIQREIAAFKSMGREKQIITILIDGEPHEAFPEALLKTKRQVIDTNGQEVTAEELSEPIAADIRANSIRRMLHLLNTEKLRILAPILGCSFDDLYQRQKKRNRRRSVGISAAILAILLLFFSGLLLYSRQLYQYRQNQAVNEITSALKSLENRYNDAYTLLVMSEGDIDFTSNLIFEATAINTTKQLLEQRLDVISKLDELYPINIRQVELIDDLLDKNNKSSDELDGFILRAKENNQCLSQTEEAYIAAVTNIKDSESLLVQHTEVSYRLVKYLCDTAFAYHRGLGLLSELGEKVVIKDAAALMLLDLRLPSFETDDSASTEEVLETEAYINKVMDKILSVQQEALEANKALIDIKKQETVKDVQKLDDLIKELTTIDSDDGPEQVAEKACSLRQLGKFEEAAALYKTYGELYKATDETAEAYSNIAQQFCLTATDYQNNYVAYVFAVMPGSLSEKAGIQAGDIIVSYNNTTEITPDTLAQAAAKAQELKEVELIILRSDQAGGFIEIRRILPGGKLGVGLMPL